MIMNTRSNSADLKLFLCGDVMPGRGIDQALPYSVDPVLYETYITDARNYLWLAEQANGNIDKPVAYHYIWGDAMSVWEENSPDMKLINLETSITTHNKPWPLKGINYRMHPENVKLLTVAGIDHCSLANNHTLDWNRPGLAETMQCLKNANIGLSGAGEDRHQAGEPSILLSDSKRVIVYSFGSKDSGIPGMWAAGDGLPGINLLPDQSEKIIDAIKGEVKPKYPEGIVIFSIHWGANWGYTIPAWHKELSYRLIDEAGVDIIYGHSSHHPLGIEVYNEKLIIYGAGDLINDYEGISGHKHYRGELSLMYFPKIDAGGRLISLKLVPMEIKKFRLNRATAKDAMWLQNTLNREGGKLGTSFIMDSENSLWAEW
jgi:poly-gamma-glutamate capsule biosynthesis protein CapA/YwtB (metallophosphatase superfamily)